MIQNANGNKRNLIYEYERLIVDDIRTHDLTYIDQKTRHTHNFFQVYQYVSNSITKAAHLKIVVELYKCNILRIKTSSTNRKRKTVTAIRIWKCYRKSFHLIKTYYYHFNICHTVFTPTYSLYPFLEYLIRITSLISDTRYHKNQCMPDLFTSVNYLSHR